MALVELLTLLAVLIVPLPIRTNRTLRAAPYATYTICFLNLFVHLATLRNSEYQMYLLNTKWGMTLAHPDLITLFTHGFLHSGWDHLFGNLLVLWIVGTVLEAGIGSVMFTLLYFASMVTAVLLYGIISRVFQPEALGIPMIGASGAIAGITGFAAFRYYHTRVMTFPCIAVFSLPIPVWMFWFPLWVYALYFGMREVLLGVGKLAAGVMGDTAHWAHIGGMALGVIAALILRTAQEGKRELVLENVAKSTSDSPKRARYNLEGKSAHDLERMLTEHPDDPELLEAAAALWTVDGNAAQARDIYLLAIPRFIAAGMADRAAVSYLNVLRAFPATVLAVREQMALAAALERLGHYREAIHAYELVLEHYRTYSDAPNALLRAALIYQRHLRQSATAAQLLQRLLADYPDSNFCSLARMRLQEINGRRS